jgi:hypothetical protein
MTMNADRQNKRVVYKTVDGVPFAPNWSRWDSADFRRAAAGRAEGKAWSCGLQSDET